MSEGIKYVVEVFRSLLVVTKELEEAKKEIKDLRETVNRLTLVLEKISNEVLMNGRQQDAALLNHKLYVENLFLKSDRFAAAYINSSESTGDSHSVRADIIKL